MLGLYLRHINCTLGNTINLQKASMNTTQFKRSSNYFSIGLHGVYLLLLVVLLVIPGKSYAQYDDDYVSYDDFYQSLAPYGQWIQDPQYGYVWSPDEDNNFRPYYTSGHWVMTEYGNTWVSDYPWGWACFHYGSWTFDEYYGWLWIPGNYWGPAWVSWRYGDGFYGWAPLGPDYRSGMSLIGYTCPGDWWVFIPPQYIYSGRYYQYWQGPMGNTRIIKHTTIINNTFEYNSVTYITGPHIAQVRQVTGNPVQVFKVRNSRNQNTRIHNDVVRMYRPAEIRVSPRATGQVPTPPNVMTAPRPVRQPQAVTSNPGATPPFRTMVINQRNEKSQTPGTNINQTAEPQRPTQRSGNNPYEWDVSRPVKQEYTPPAPRQSAPARNNQQPARANTPARQQPAREQPTRQQPAPQTPSQPAVPTPAPQAPSQQQGQRPGGRR
jgi:hypothetical protein